MHVLQQQNVAIYIYGTTSLLLTTKILNHIQLALYRFGIDDAQKLCAVVCLVPVEN
jgi:hypothetical protein